MKLMGERHMTYFEQHIQLAKMFGHPAMEMPNAANATQWIERLENELSPENLTCDGELSRTAVRTKSRMLNDALNYARSFATRSLLTGPFTATNWPRQLSAARRQRTMEREKRLNDAVDVGFRVGVMVQISNGVRGQIVKINRTRVTVKGEDHRMWSVPPRCMTLGQRG